MASVHPAMRGKFGSTEFFILTMKASDVARRLTIPKEMPDWGQLGLEDIYQRQINYTGVKKFIAPYLAHDPDRFFGALIVTVINSEDMEFENLDNVPGKTPKLYQSATKSFGFLTFNGGEMLVPLDGQHRLAAIQFALSGKDEKQKPIPEIVVDPSLATDDILLILVRNHPIKGRKIFNKVNRYAKATSKAENLITADDDVIAIISREIVANELIGGRLVNYQSNTLSNSMPYFTTLSTIYEATKHLLEKEFGKISTTELPDTAVRRVYENIVRTYWEHLIQGVDLYNSALLDSAETGDARRKEIRKEFLLGKPVAQLALMIAVVRLKHIKKNDGSKFSWDEIVHRINGVKWNNGEPIWQNILMNGSRVVTGKQATIFAGRFIAYYLGENLNELELKSLKRSYINRFPDDERRPNTLPPSLFSL